MVDLKKRATILTEPETCRHEEGLRILARIISRHLEEESVDRNQELLKRKLTIVPETQKDEKQTYG